MVVQEVRDHIALVISVLKPIFVSDVERISGGKRLWSQFEQAVISFENNGRPQVKGVIERINELVVAKRLIHDAQLTGASIEYEPEIIPGGQKFDFVLKSTSGETNYIEVKTVQPTTDDSEDKWRQYQQRKDNLSPQNRYIVCKELMGATIFGNSFSARSSFMKYTIETEAKLNEHNKFRPGTAILVFCGTGFEWDISDLEDFAHFYRTGQHRFDDPFATMEHHSMKTKAELLRNLDGFGALICPHDAPLCQGSCPLVYFSSISQVGGIGR